MQLSGKNLEINELTHKAVPLRRNHANFHCHQELDAELFAEEDFEKTSQTWNPQLSEEEHCNNRSCRKCYVETTRTRSYRRDPTAACHGKICGERNEILGVDQQLETTQQFVWRPNQD